jgi:hypothetical protein
MFNTNTNGVSPMAEFDIAQFVSAISSQMPRVQDASPQGASSSNTGPSPQTGDLNSKGKTDKGKIVKVSWFRPHGITAIAPGMFYTSGLADNRFKAIYFESQSGDASRDLETRSA